MEDKVVERWWLVDKVAGNVVDDVVDNMVDKVVDTEFLDQKYSGLGGLCFPSCIVRFHHHLAASATLKALT